MRRVKLLLLGVIDVIALVATFLASQTVSTAYANDVVRPSSGAVLGSQQTVTVAEATASGTQLYVVTPCRVIDTRNPDGPYGGPTLNANATRTIFMAGKCGIPANASAVVINVTAVAPLGSGSLSLYPAGISQPGTSTVSYRAGRTRGNNAVIALANNGALDAYNGGAGPLHFIIDVTGYFRYLFTDLIRV